MHSASQSCMAHVCAAASTNAAITFVTSFCVGTSQKAMDTCSKIVTAKFNKSDHMFWVDKERGMHQDSTTGQLPYLCAVQT